MSAAADTDGSGFKSQGAYDRTHHQIPSPFGATSAGFSGCPAGRDIASDLMSDLIHFLSKLVQAVRDVIRKKKR